MNLIGRLTIKKQNYVDHHLSHAASSVLASNYMKTNSNFDGFGRFLSTTVGSYAKINFTLLKKQNFSFIRNIWHSYYSTSRFENYGDETKLWDYHMVVQDI